MTAAAPITAKHRRRSPQSPFNSLYQLPSSDPTPTNNRIQRTPTSVRSPSSLNLQFSRYTKENP
ncbi:hypothetical protein COLO4_38501 [Corchorus olitorius]|uniref:Uncharacterized protein n=1 Tax=Corchorus olitorius TaxID=93759 RepID=A0A1R3FUV7_9ROSI|nr:hypothetical protein COLO4_38501 [Corchorus olitorius]